MSTIYEKFKNRLQDVAAAAACDMPNRMFVPTCYNTFALTELGKDMVLQHVFGQLRIKAVKVSRFYLEAYGINPDVTKDGSVIYFSVPVTIEGASTITVTLKIQVVE